MPQSSPFKIILSPAERSELESRAERYTLPYFQVVRARMILYASEDMPNDDIARRLDTRREVVSLWRKRFFEERLAGLCDATGRIFGLMPHSEAFVRFTAHPECTAQPGRASSPGQGLQIFENAYKEAVRVSS